jgi:hypothetical protein
MKNYAVISAVIEKKNCMFCHLLSFTFTFIQYYIYSIEIELKVKNLLTILNKKITFKVTFIFPINKI